MNTRIFQLRVLTPCVSRWVNFPNHNPYIRFGYFFTRACATCSFRRTGIPPGVGDNDRVSVYSHKYPALSWENHAVQHNVFAKQWRIVRCYSRSENNKVETKAGSPPAATGKPNASSTEGVDIGSGEEVTEKLSLVQRFKKMYRDYWYVLVPVHVVTSIGWFGSFYYLTKSGVDVVAMLEYLGLSESIISPLRDSSAGYFALAYAMYKIATPLRYTVTLGGTTISIKYLKEFGYIKPIPPKAKLKEMYQEQKDSLKERRDNIAEEFRQQKERFKERRENLMDEYRRRTRK